MRKRKVYSVKNTTLFFRRKMYALVTLSLGIFLFVSCANDGFNSDEKFSSDVVNTTLESPKAEDIVITPSADGAKVAVKWPVVYGAGGYQFSLYIVDDPNNPVAVGTENEIVDGCSATRALEEDTKYKVVVKTMGNTKYNNSDAQAATEVSYSTLLPTYATIPSGSDITAYFASNPIPDSADELAYNLEVGGTYTMSGVVDFGNHKVTFRGDKINHPKVTYGAAARLCTSAGLKIKFIDFDCSAQDGLAADASFLSLSATPAIPLGTGSYYIITDPIVVQSCKVTGVKGYIFYNNQKKYCVKTFLMKNDVFQCNSAQTSTAYIYINKGDGAIIDFTAQNSTFYDLSATGNKYFIQYGSSARPDRPGFISGSLNFYNNTFYNIANKGQMGNYNSMRSNKVYFNLAQNIFYNCGSGEVCRRFMGGGTGMITTFSKNSYWYNGVFSTAELTYDKSNTAIQSEPTFTDAANGVFTVTSADHQTARCGDPRWLPTE